MTRLDHALQDLSNDGLFQSTVREITDELGMSSLDLALKLSVSKTTVDAWKAGTMVPLPLMRKPVYRVLQRKLTETSP